MVFQALVACLRLVQQCQPASEGSLRLAQTAIRCIVFSGREALLLYAPLTDSPPTDADNVLALLGAQLCLAMLCIQAPGMTAAAVTDAVPPEQLAAWLASVADVLKAYGRRSDTGGRAPLHAAPWLAAAPGSCAQRLHSMA